MSLQGTSGKAAGGLLAAAAAAVGVTASLGAGYTVAHAALADGSAYVAKGTALAHVNGEARKTDAVGRALAKQGEGLDVVALPGNRVAVINRKTNTITTVDGATMTPTATVRPKTAGSVLVVSSGPGGWLVSHDARTATPLRDGRPGRPVGLPGAPADAAPAPNGGLFVLADDGKLARVDANGSVHAVPTDAAPRGALTVGGGSAYLVTVDGAVFRLDRSTPEVVATVSGLAPAPEGRMVVGALTSDGPHVLVVSPDGLAVVDPDTGRAPFRVLHAPGDALGRPVEYKGRAYVPDYDAHQVLVVDIATQRVLKPLKVPGSEQSFALFVSGGRLWANDQYAQHLLEVDGASPHTVDKGPGNGVSDDRRRGAASPGRGVAPPGGGTVPRNAPPVGRGTLPPVSSPVGPPGVGAPPVHGSPKGSGPGGSTTPRAPVKRVTVPLFPPHTNYVDACARIEALGPTCQPVSGGTDTDGDTGDVIATIPAGGSQIAVTEHVVVSYVGPVTVPALPDNVPPTPADVCLAVEAAKLRCDPEPASSPAQSAAQFGLVADLDPAAGGEADKGATVTVHYYDTFPMPDAVGAAQPGQSLCTQLGALVVELPNR